MLFQQLQKSLYVVILYRPRQLPLQTQPGTAKCGTEGFTMQLRKTYIYKKQAKHYLLLTSPPHVH